MSCTSDDKSDVRHDQRGGRQVVSRTSKLRLTPDDHSETSQVGWSPQAKERPHGYPDAANIWRGAGPTLNLYEGADMAKRTRGRAPADSRPRSSGVKITPPTHAGPVTTTYTVA